VQRLEGKFIEELMPINFESLELFKANEVVMSDKVIKGQ
jgi:hypothetical protein